MPDHSQDLSKQLKQLQNQAQIAEAKATAKNAEAQVAQRKLDSLESQIAKQTERLLAEQTEQLASARKPFDKELNEQKILFAKLEGKISKSQTVLQNLVVEINEAEAKLNVAQVELVATQTANAIQKQIGDKLIVANERILATQHTIEMTISERTAESDSLRSDIQVLQDIYKDWQQRSDAAKATYTADTAEKEKQTSLLNAKLLDVRQEIDKIQQEDMTVRDKLATWQKSLESRDQNLRIRESKVEQGESKLLQNSSLLNL